MLNYPASLELSLNLTVGNFDHVLNDSINLFVHFKTFKKIVKEKWPSIPKSKLFKDAIQFSVNHGKKGVPLYQNLSENIHYLKPYQPSQETLDFIDAFEKLSLRQ